MPRNAALSEPAEFLSQSRRFPSGAIRCLPAEACMNGSEFVTKLKAENEAILAKIDESPVSSGVPKGELLATLIKMALKNEIEATEIAADGVSTTPELHAKLALARHAGDGALLYHVIEEMTRAMSVSLY